MSKDGKWGIKLWEEKFWGSGEAGKERLKIFSKQKGLKLLYEL